MKTPMVSSATSFQRVQTSLQSPMPRLPGSNVYSTRDPANRSASVHRKRFFTPSLTLEFLCAGYLNPRCVSGLLSAGHAEAAAEDAGAGPDAEGRARKARRHADDRCRTAHDGRSGGRHVPLYRAREGSVAPASTVEDSTSCSTAPKNHSPEQPRSRVSDHPL